MENLYSNKRTINDKHIWVRNWQHSQNVWKNNYPPPPLSNVNFIPREKFLGGKKLQGSSRVFNTLPLQKWNTLLNLSRIFTPPKIKSLDVLDCIDKIVENPFLFPDFLDSHIDCTFWITWNINYIIYIMILIQEEVLRIE